MGIMSSQDWWGGILVFICLFGLFLFLEYKPGGASRQIDYPDGLVEVILPNDMNGVVLYYRQDLAYVRYLAPDDTYKVSQFHKHELRQLHE